MNQDKQKQLYERLYPVISELLELRKWLKDYEQEEKILISKQLLERLDPLLLDLIQLEKSIKLYNVRPYGY